jgi:hypothetical protein
MFPLRRWHLWLPCTTSITASRCRTPCPGAVSAIPRWSQNRPCHPSAHWHTSSPKQAPPLAHAVVHASGAVGAVMLASPPAPTAAATSPMFTKHRSGPATRWRHAAHTRQVPRHRRWTVPPRRNSHLRETTNGKIAVERHHDILAHSNTLQSEATISVLLHGLQDSSLHQPMSDQLLTAMREGQTAIMVAHI